MKTLYAIITKHCNLNCPHCDIRSDQKEVFNESLFLKRLREFSGHKILFGGEPSIVMERTEKALPYCNSISTNLYQVSEKFIGLIKKYGVSVATSWNPLRFTKEQEERWIYNLKTFSLSDVICLVTLTPDLFDATKHFLTVFDKISPYISSVIFEQIHDDSKR